MTGSKFLRSSEFPLLQFRTEVWAAESRDCDQPLRAGTQKEVVEQRYKPSDDCDDVPTAYTKLRCCSLQTLGKRRRRVMWRAAASCGAMRPSLVLNV
jgi:hypothetical protein